MADLDRRKYHRVMFTIAAFWNWIVAVTFIILPRIDISYFSIAGDVPPPNTLLWFDSFMGFIFVFGIGYYIISLNIEKNHGLIAMVSIEKAWVFVLAVLYFVIGEASGIVVAIATVDIIFGILFIEQLFAIRKGI